MPSLLDDLIAHSVDAVPPSDQAWRESVEHVAETLDVGPGTGIFDIACGAGAFLYPLWENGYIVGGLDLSPERLALARAAMPDGRFVPGDASTLDPAEGWDVVIAWNVLHRLTDLDQARAVLSRMSTKATHAIALLNLPEAAPGEPAASSHARGPTSLSYDRRWLLRALAEIGVTAVHFEDTPPADGRQRFNLFAKV